MKQPSFEATHTKVDVEDLSHCLTIISSPELSLKLKGNLYSNPFSTSPATVPKCWANYWANLPTLNYQPGLVSLEVQVQETPRSSVLMNEIQARFSKITHPTKTCTLWLELLMESSTSDPTEQTKIIFISNQKFVKEITQRSLVSYTISYLRSIVCK